MRIAYFDEAGIADEQQEPYVVVGGILIHGDTQWQPIENRVHRIINTLVPQKLRERAPFVFHGRHLYSDNKRFFRLLSRDERFVLLREVLRIVHDFKLPISYGAIIKSALRKLTPPNSKVALRINVAHQAAFSLCATGFQGWFNREAPDEVAICVADRAEERQQALKLDFSTMRLYGFPERQVLPLYNFVDALHFAALEESVGLQIADCATFVIKRHLMEKADTEEFYNMIENQLVIKPSSALWPQTPSAHI